MMGQLVSIIADLCSEQHPTGNSSDNRPQGDYQVNMSCSTEWQSIPVAGNAYITREHQDNAEVVTENGLGDWCSTESVISVYFHVDNHETLDTALRLKVPQRGESTIRISLHGTTQSFRLDISGEEYHIVNVGQFKVTPGYVQLDLQGVERTGLYFADVANILIRCGIEVSCVRDDFYFGRRGPSVHLNYRIPPKMLPVEYFYNEVTVPDSKDIVGSYFAAAGFRGGYLGFQVNSTTCPTERRVLFSIWSEYSTDDPADIPEEYRVQLIRRGENTFTGEFGNEGSGGQSYMRYNWAAGRTYRFLIYCTPLDDDNTIFTAWFNGDENEWLLIASWRKPKVSHYLTSPYSFSENFIPEKGFIERRAYFGNQWIRDIKGNWSELTHATYTADATANKRSRLDFSGGSEGDQFYLRNCGFFSDRVEYNQDFFRNPSNRNPNIIVENLP